MTNFKEVARRSDAICVLHSEVEKLQQLLQRILDMDVLPKDSELKRRIAVALEEG